jgi:hypothetical protein
MERFSGRLAVKEGVLTRVPTLADNHVLTEQRMPAVLDAADLGLVRVLSNGSTGWQS